MLQSEPRYTGHGRSGALQEHSKGELYPYTIVGTCHNAGPTRYYWQNLLTGQRGEEMHTYNLAEIDLHSRKLYAFMNA